MARATGTPRAAAAGKVCVYCGEAHLDGTQRPEHPLPHVLGADITVFTACTWSNEEAGRRVDQPWLNHFFVQNERVKWGAQDKRHKDRPAIDPLFDRPFVDEDGHRVIVRDRVPTYPGSIVRDGDRISIAADTEERAAELLERVKRQLAEDGHTVGDYTQEIRSSQPRVNGDVEVSLFAGVRMGAKLGLAFGAEAFDEAWRLSDEAEQLREWMWGETPISPTTGNPLAWQPSTEERHPLAEPPNHTIFFSRIDDTIVLTVLAFGTLGFAVPVAPADLGVPEIAWKSGPAYRPPLVTTHDQLLQGAMMRHRAAHAVLPWLPEVGPLPA
jgi:hypothetical protein